MLGASNNAKMWNLTADAVSKDIVLQSNIRDSFHRKLYTHVNSALMNGIKADTSATGTIPLWVLILEILMCAGYTGFLVFLVLYLIQERKERRA